MKHTYILQVHLINYYFELLEYNVINSNFPLNFNILRFVSLNHDSYTKLTKTKKKIHRFDKRILK